MSKISNHEIRNRIINNTRTNEKMESPKILNNLIQKAGYTYYPKVLSNMISYYALEEAEMISVLMSEVYEERNIYKNIKDMLLLIIKNINIFLNNTKNEEEFFNKMNEFQELIIKKAENKKFYKRCSVPEFDILSVPFPFNDSRISIEGAKSAREEKKKLEFNVILAKQRFYITITPLKLDIQRNEGKGIFHYSLNLRKSRVGNVVEKTTMQTTGKMSVKNPSLKIEEFFNELEESLDKARD